PRCSSPSIPLPALSRTKTASTKTYTLSLHDALPISVARPTAATASLRSPPPARAAPTPSRTGTRCSSCSIGPAIKVAPVPPVPPAPRVLPEQQARRARLVPRAPRVRPARPAPQELRVQPAGPAPLVPPAPRVRPAGAAPLVPPAPRVQP